MDTLHTSGGNPSRQEASIDPAAISIKCPVIMAVRDSCLEATSYKKTDEKVADLEKRVEESEVPESLCRIYSTRQEYLIDQILCGALLKSKTPSMTWSIKMMENRLMTPNFLCPAKNIMSDYYVYVYIDPRNYEEFYYGKGCGSRKDVHLTDASESRKARRSPRFAVLVANQLFVSSHAV